MKKIRIDTDRIRKISNRINFLPEKKVLNDSLNEMTVKEMIHKMRKERVYEQDTLNYLPLSNSEIELEKDKFRNVFKDDNVDIDFDDFIVTDKGIIFGGTIDGQIQWAYRVAPEEQLSGVDYNTIEGFDPSVPENAAIIKKLESYYDTFYDFCRDNILNVKTTDNNVLSDEDE